MKHSFNAEQVNILSPKTSPLVRFNPGNLRGAFSFPPQHEIAESGKLMLRLLTKETRNSVMAGCPQGQALCSST